MNGVLLAMMLVLQGTAPAPAGTAADLPPPPEQVMAIPADLRAQFRREVVDATPFPEARLQRLVSFVYAKSGLGVEYKPDATHTVAESFASREVNCLSSTLLVVALAREAGLRADGQQVDRIMTWGASGSTVIQSKHVNAVVRITEKREFVVDVDGEGDLPIRDAPDPMSDAHLLALFYGNRAMELLLEDRLAEARLWLDAAFRQEPNDAGLLNNAGVLSLRGGDAEAAEAYFLKAIDRNPQELSALSNLVQLYRKQGDSRAAYWGARADEVLRTDPYYQFTLGRQHELAGRYDEALRQYSRAVRLNRGEPRFRFGLARVHYLAGNYRKADRALEKAARLATGIERGQYQNKLAALRRLERSARVN